MGEGECNWLPVGQTEKDVTAAKGVQSCGGVNNVQNPWETT